MIHVVVRKIDISDDPVNRTAVDRTLEAQDLGNESPWVGYEIEGVADSPPVESEPFCVHRTVRNGKDIPGAFRTSPIRCVRELDTGWQVETLNSLYWVGRL